MYVNPRPRYEDDRYFAVRLSLGVTLSFVAAVINDAQMPMTYPAITLGLLAGNLRAFDPRRLLAAPIAIIVLLWIISFVISALMPFRLILIAVLFSVNLLGFYIIQTSGNSMGLVLLMFPALLSVTGFDSLAFMEIMRNDLMKALLVAGFMSPFLYAILPTRTNEVHEPVYVRGHDEGQYLLRAAIRASVLLVFGFSVYAILGSANLMMVIAGIFVLCFPTQRTTKAEAQERSLSTAIGGVAAIVVLAVASITGHAIVILVTVYAMALGLTSKMYDGRFSPMVYQFGLSVAVSVISSGLSAQEPLYMATTRMVLTLGGALAAALLTTFLEDLLTRPADAAVTERAGG